uniref:Uncharacterized protein n=1 Tax=Lactuca sativa TaxID=4236 RepID=A0A9R1VI58_LACSA|nr:hypothetical protein LSAT_V11C500291400 [Lactuca sativa]
MTRLSTLSVPEVRPAYWVASGDRGLGCVCIRPICYISNHILPPLPKPSPVATVVQAIATRHRFTSMDLDLDISSFNLTLAPSLWCADLDLQVKYGLACKEDIIEVVRDILKHVLQPCSM